MFELCNTESSAKRLNKSRARRFPTCVYKVRAMRTRGVARENGLLIDTPARVIVLLRNKKLLLCLSGVKGVQGVEDRKLESGYLNDCSAVVLSLRRVTGPMRSAAEILSSLVVDPSVRRKRRGK